jgi:Na+/alanine symporter
MISNKIKAVSKACLVICAVALSIILVVPMWRIELNAPQYPEGLKLLIFANRLAGNVDIINGLNHYIGMKNLYNITIHHHFFLCSVHLNRCIGQEKMAKYLIHSFCNFWRIGHD